MNDDITTHLLRYEALRLTPYDDATGRELKPGDTLIGSLTIGVGRNLTATTLSEEEWRLMLSRDIATAIKDARYLCPVYDHLSRPRQLVLLSMAFNLGRSRFSLWRHFLSAAEIGDHDEAANQILDSRAAKQAPDRYQALAWMWRKDTIA